MKAASSNLVYSTEVGRVCHACRQAQAACTCTRDAIVGDGNVRATRQTKGRGGKCVTVIQGVALDAPALSVLAKQLRSACGSGGTVKDGIIEVQGDHVVRILEQLQRHGIAAT